MTPEDCAQAIRESFPDLALAQPRRLEEGWSFHTFLAGDIVWRFPRTPHDAALLEREARLLPAVAARVGFAVPVAKWLGVWRDVPFAGAEFITGEPLHRDDLESESVASSFGEALAELHGVAVHDVVPHLAEAPSTSGWRKRHRHLLEAIEVRTSGLLSPATSRTVRRRLTVALDRFDFTPTIVHGDLGYNALRRRFDHVLVREGAVGGILDFSDMTIGDPAVDYAGVWHAGGWETVERVAGDRIPELGERFRERVAFHFWVAPLHDILYGLDTHDDGLVGENIVELDNRLEATGIVT